MSVFGQRPLLRSVVVVCVVEMFAAGSGREVDNPRCPSVPIAVEFSIENNVTGNQPSPRVRFLRICEVARRETQGNGALIIMLVPAQHEIYVVFFKERTECAHVLLMIVLGSDVEGRMMICDKAPAGICCREIGLDPALKGFVGGVDIHIGIQAKE